MSTPPIKVALVEDDIALATMYRTKLEHEDMKVQTASTTAAAIELMASFHPNIVLLDVMMPDANGLEVLSYLRSRQQDDEVRVIIMTNLDDIKLRRSLQQMGISDYLVKAAVTPAQVIATIREVMKR